ncbi:MAG: dodecin [Gemmatimonadota bacterium]
MEATTYKSIELVGTSAESYADATRVAIARARQTMRQLKWFEVTEMRGQIREDGDLLFQVRLEVWFALES